VSRAPRLVAAPRHEFFLKKRRDVDTRRAARITEPANGAVAIRGNSYRAKPTVANRTVPSAGPPAQITVLFENVAPGQGRRQRWSPRRFLSMTLARGLAEPRRGEEGRGRYSGGIRALRVRVALPRGCLLHNKSRRATPTPHRASGGEGLRTT